MTNQRAGFEKKASSIPYASYHRPVSPHTPPVHQNPPPLWEFSAVLNGPWAAWLRSPCTQGWCPGNDTPVELCYLPGGWFLVSPGQCPASWMVSPEALLSWLMCRLLSMYFVWPKPFVGRWDSVINRLRYTVGGILLGWTVYGCKCMTIITCSSAPTMHWW